MPSPSPSLFTLRHSSHGRQKCLGLLTVKIRIPTLWSITNSTLNSTLIYLRRVVSGDRLSPLMDYRSAAVPSVVRTSLRRRSINSDDTLQTVGGAARPAGPVAALAPAPRLRTPVERNRIKGQSDGSTRYVD